MSTIPGKRLKKPLHLYHGHGGAGRDSIQIAGMEYKKSPVLMRTIIDTNRQSESLSRGRLWKTVPKFGLLPA